MKSGAKDQDHSARSNNYNFIEYKMDKQLFKEIDPDAFRYRGSLFQI